MSRFVSNKLKTIFLDEEYKGNNITELKVICKEKWITATEGRNISELLELLNNNREWVKIAEALSFEDISKITGTTDEMEMSKIMLVTCIREWNIKDEEGKIPELNEENIMKLDTDTITILLWEISKVITTDNKKKPGKKLKK